MKRLLTILLIVVFAVSASAASAPPQTKPHQGRQAVYNRYSAQPDLSVAKIDGFKLNDTVKVDVLILVADNAAAWDKLCQVFDIRSQSSVSTWTGKGDHPETRVKWQGKPSCKVIASPARRTLCMYYIDNETEYESLMDYQMDLMSKKPNNNK